MVSSGREYDAEQAMEVVGVVRANRWYGPKQGKLPFRGMYWMTLEQSKRPFLVALLKTANDPAAAAPALKRVLREEMPGMLVTTTATMRQLRDDSLQQERMLATLFSFFAAIGLALIFAGFYGLLTYTVERRVPELGIRIALGASTRDVVAMVGRESVTLVGLGLVLGLPATLGVARLLEKYLFGIRSTDAASYAWTLAVIAAIGMVAAVRPARQAASISPTDAIRAE
jgi:ABC-type antimicrobial peptide transport system permease subunit